MTKTEINQSLNVSIFMWDGERCIQ